MLTVIALASACGACVVEQTDETAYGEAELALVDDPGNVDSLEPVHEPDYVNPEPQPWNQSSLASADNANPEPQPWTDDDDDDGPDANPEPQPWSPGSERDDGESEPNPLPWQHATIVDDGEDSDDPHVKLH